MTNGNLPGDKRPYFLKSGEGERYLFGGQQLATIIARAQDTGGLIEAAVVSGPLGSEFPAHSHIHSREALLILDGKLELFVDRQSCLLSRGDFASIPPGVIHGYRMRGQRTRFLAWNVGGNAGEIYSVLGDPYDGYVYPANGIAAIPDNRLATAESGLDVRFSGLDLPSTAAPMPFASQPPGGISPFVLESGEGERLIGGDSLFTFLAHQGNTGGEFITLTTQGPKGGRIPNHFHERHTETFFCLDGCMTMWVDNQEVSMFPGDFLHAPSGTIHSFRLDAPYTNFAGILAPGLFEPFFRTLCDPYEPYIFPQAPGPLRFDRVMQRLHELDLKLVDQGPPRQG